jgi:hypothetical protein
MTSASTLPLKDTSLASIVDAVPVSRCTPPVLEGAAGLRAAGTATSRTRRPIAMVTSLFMPQS